ncbi:hypothetical protein MAHJHV55_52810 [Mycobacterium avium subsp. hominissuis]
MIRRRRSTRPATRRLDAGDQAGFPLGWVHDVVWAPRPVSGPASRRAVAAAQAAPTLSVHAYSPPLTGRGAHTTSCTQPSGKPA